jgi:mannose-6-phosphate isomerase-like protein (cupin superfamily)
MPVFDRAVVSIPGKQRYGLTPFLAPIVVHASAGETGGSFGAWDTITPPGKGPAEHMHTRESELFRVIDSTYHFICGDDEFDASPGTFVALPPHVPHKWWNIGDGMGLMMGMAAPGGCEQMFLDIAAAGSSDPSDIARIEAHIGVVNAETKALGFVEPTGPERVPFPRAVVSFPDIARRIPNGRGGYGILHATADETAGAFGAWEGFPAPGAGPTWHTHTRETETFRVLAGTFGYWCGDDYFEGGTGTVISLPPHVPHRWQNVGDTPGHVFGIVAPGGFERYFLEIERRNATTAEAMLAIETELGIIDSGLGEQIEAGHR